MDEYRPDSTKWYLHTYVHINNEIFCQVEKVHTLGQTHYIYISDGYYVFEYLQRYFNRLPFILR